MARRYTADELATIEATRLAGDPAAFRLLAWRLGRNWIEMHRAARLRGLAGGGGWTAEQDAVLLDYRRRGFTIRQIVDVLPGRRRTPGAVGMRWLLLRKRQAVPA